MIVRHQAGPVSANGMSQSCARCGFRLLDGSGAEFVEGYGIIGIGDGETVEWRGPYSLEVRYDAEPNCTDLRSSEGA